MENLVAISYFVFSFGKKSEGEAFRPPPLPNRGAGSDLRKLAFSLFLAFLASII